MGGDRDPLTFDSGSLGIHTRLDRTGSLHHTRVELFTTRKHMSDMLTRRGIPCKSAFINVTFVSQTKKQTSKSS